MDLKFKIGDKVKTLVNKDYKDNELFPTGTEGIITSVNPKGKYPYCVSTYDGNYWYYDEKMIELIKDKVDKSKVFKLVSDVIAETEGDNELLKDVVYYIECYRKREHLK